MLILPIPNAKMATMKNKIILPMLLPIVLLSSCGNRPSGDDVVFTQIDSLFTSLYPANEPGAAVIIVKNDTIIYNKGFGMARMDTNEPISGRTFFNIASVSKQFSAVALFMLAKEGKISLDDPVSKYFPEYKADFYKQITLRHLLSHTSGIPDARPRLDREFVLTANDEESASYLVELDKLNFEPGTQYEYMNPTYQIMLWIIEQASGEQFDDFMRNRIFTPVGMAEATYFEPDKQIPRMSHGYLRRANDTVWTEYDYGEESFFRTKADGGIYTSPEEFVMWDRALKNNLLFSEKMKEEAHSGKIDTDIPYTQYGYGWFIEERPDRPKKVYHTGDNGGYQIFAGRFPDKDLFYLVFANRNDKDREVTVEAMDQIFEKAGWLK
jgi:CubicO group peptidase (beta-lactamase class C family)